MVVFANQLSNVLLKVLGVCPKIVRLCFIQHSYTCCSWCQGSLGVGCVWGIEVEYRRDRESQYLSTGKLLAVSCITFMHSTAFLTIVQRRRDAQLYLLRCGH